MIEINVRVWPIIIYVTCKELSLVRNELFKFLNIISKL